MDTPYVTAEIQTEAADELTPAVTRAEKETALLRAFTEWRGALTGYCRQLGVAEDRIDDALQEAWMHAHQCLDQLRDLRAIGGWVRRILWSQATNAKTRRREWTTNSEGDEESGFWGASPPEEDPLMILVEEEEAAAVRASIALLSELDRRSLDAFYMRRLRLRQIAAEEDAPIGTIKRRLHTARHRLKNALPSDFHESA